MLDDALWHLEEPIADLSFLGFLLLSRLARETVTVVLCGQAADELLAGYRKHRVAHAADLFARVPAAIRRSIDMLAGSLSGGSSAHRLLRAIATEDDVDRLLAMSSVMSSDLRHELLDGRLASVEHSALLRATLAGLGGRGDHRSYLNRTLTHDLKLALPDLMFLYFDKMSMAASLEVRVPFADHDLVTFCTALPDDRRIRGWRGKELLRRASVGLVDESIINRPKRGFFRSASGSWLAHQESLVRETLLDPRCADRGVLDAGTLRSWLAKPDQTGRRGEPLLMAFLLERWHRQFVDSDGIAHQRARAARQAAGILDPLLPTAGS